MDICLITFFVSYIILKRKRKQEGRKERRKEEESLARSQESNLAMDAGKDLFCVMKMEGFVHS